MKIARGVYFYKGRRGDSFRRGTGSSNVTLIQGDSLAMIDTGLSAGGAFRDLSLRIHEDCITLGDIAWLMYTHGHWDHLNASDEVLSQCRAKVAAGSLDVPLIEDRDIAFSFFLPEDDRLRQEIHPYPPFTARALLWFVFGRQPSIRVDRHLADGDSFDIGRRIEALSLPGHTPGQMGYFLPDEGVIITGDLLDFDDGHGMDINNPSSDYGAAISSLEKAAKLGARILIPGHGEPAIGVKGVRALIEKALDTGHAYPEMILKSLAKGPLRLKEITYALFPGIPFTQEALSMMLVMTVLRHMEKEERVAASYDRRGRPVWSR
jgi:glyoxylase-like metal-dependent hydrolase (beta-lactamase superfamily II)